MTVHVPRDFHRECVIDFSLCPARHSEEEITEATQIMVTVVWTGVIGIDGGKHGQSMAKYLFVSGGNKL